MSRPIKELVADLKASYPRLEEAIPGLKRKSDIEYRGVCPSCEEERLGVFPKDQRFWCYGCECSGDIIEYYRIIGRGTMERQIARMEAGNLGIPTGSTQISFTCFTKSKGILTKRMKLEDGQLVKDASECRMSKGRAETVTLAPEQFGAFLQKLKQNQAIAHGICEHSKAFIVSKAKETGAIPAYGWPSIARTKEHFRYPAGPGLLMLDHDKARDNAVSLDAKAVQTYSPDELAEIISGFLPEIKQAAYLSSCSTSSCIYNTETGEELRGKGAGFHLYLFPQNASDVPRFLAALGKRLVLAGYGRVEISRAGSLLERTLADLLVGSPERLDFVAGAVCDKGLEQRRPEPEYHPGGLLNTAKLPDLSTKEEAAYQEIIRQLKEKAQPAQEQIKSAYLEQEAEKMAKDSGGRISLEQARETVKARQSHVLADADLLHFAHLEEPVSVAHAMNNGPDFNGKACADPLEPEYNGSRSTAKFYWNDGKPLVQSYAHGGIQYTFSRFAEAAENKKPVEVWSFADVEAILEQNPELLKWMVCAPDQELTTVQKHELAEEILLHNSFRPAQLNAVREMLKERLGIAKGEQDKILKAAPKEKKHEDEQWFLVEEGNKGELRLMAQSRAAQKISEMTCGKFMYAPDIQHWHHFTGTHWANDSKDDNFGSHLVSSLEKGAGPVGFSAGYMEGVETIMVRSGRNKPEKEDEAEKVQRVPFLNGILDPETKEFQETTPENALRWCLPYKYVPDAGCEGFKLWLDMVCDDDTGGLQKLIRAMINVCLMERPDLQYFIHLQGEPGTGKGTLARLLKEIVGPQGFWKSDIELLENDKFEPANYYQKRLLQFDEVPAHVKRIKNFLALTGRDPVRFEEKQKQADQHFTYTGLVLLLGNSLFSTDDQTTFAIERRRRTVRFDKVLPESDRREFADAGGEELLHEEIPGIINWALGMSREEVSEVFYNPPAKVVEANQEAEEVASPVVKFITEHVQYEPAGKVYPGVKREYSEMIGSDGLKESRKQFEGQEDKLYPRYLAWCLREDKKPLARGKALDAILRAINRKLVPEGGAKVEMGSKEDRDKRGIPITGINLVPWEETAFGS